MHAPVRSSSTCPEENCHNSFDCSQGDLNLNLDGLFFPCGFSARPMYKADEKRAISRKED